VDGDLAEAAWQEPALVDVLADQRMNRISVRRGRRADGHGDERAKVRWSDADRYGGVTGGGDGAA
jgi:hypothetical protein